MFTNNGQLSLSLPHLTVIKVISYYDSVIACLVMMILLSVESKTVPTAYMLYSHNVLTYVIVSGIYLEEIFEGET